MSRRSYVVPALAMALACCGGAVMAQDAAPMSAKQLAQEFAGNKNAAMQKYGGKVLLVKGTIGRLNLNQFGTANMILDGEYTSQGMLAWLRAGQNAQAVSVGQTVTLRCEVQKNNDLLQDCVFVP